MPELTGRFGNFVFAAKGLSAVLVVALGLLLITLGGAVVWAFG
jgi:hypothetical protein